MQLFSKQPRKEWLELAWSGYDVWSEKVLDKNSPNELGEKIAKEVEKFDFPVVIALPKKLEVIGVDKSTGKAGMWGFGLSVYWPANWRYDKQIESFISTATNTTGRLGSCTGKGKVKKNYAEVATNLKDCKVWNCNFNAAKKEVSKKLPDIEKLELENDLNGLCEAIGYPDRAIQQTAIKSAINVAGKMNTRDARHALFDAILNIGRPEDVIGMFVRSQTVPGWGDLSYNSSEAVKAMGSEGVEFLLPLLDHPDESSGGVRMTAIKVLGRSKDMRALKPILQQGIKFSNGDKKGDCAIACANLCNSDPDQFKEIYKECKDTEERDFLRRAASIAGKSDLLK